MVTRNLDGDARRELDDLLLARPGEVDEETGLAPPSWWRGEDDAVESSAAFLKALRR